MRRIREQKSQIGALQGIIATLILVGVLVSAGFFILQEFIEQDELADTSATVTNETGLTITNVSSTEVATVDEAGFNSFSVTECFGNATGTGNVAANLSIASGNYTTDADLGTIDAVGAANYTDVACSYGYNYGEDSFIGVNDTLDAMTTIPDLLGLIILISIIGIVLAVVFNVIPGARVSGA